VFDLKTSELGPWGIVVPSDILVKTMKTWGPTPIFFKVEGIYFPPGPTDQNSTEEVKNYFGTKVFSTIEDFCRNQNSGFILNLCSADTQLTAAILRSKAQGVTMVEGAVADHFWNYIRKLEEVTLEREIYLQALNSTVEGIQITNAEGVNIFINESLLQMMDLTLEERLGKSVFDLSPDGGLVRALTERVSVANIRNHPVGTDKEFLTNASPIYVNGSFYGAVAVGRDITEIERLSKELEINKEKVAILDKKVEHLTSAKYTFDDVIGNSRPVRDIIRLAKKAASQNVNVLIQGESGTGKEIIANAMHYHSSRRNNPFIAINCAAIPEQLLESEFFGYEKGAFTSANTRKLGMFDLAHQGTLFLDEIGDMSLNLQSKLLRVLQNKQYLRVGGTKPVKVDVRIIVATNRDLSQLIQENRFREDLFYRLNVINLVLPPLRERVEDIPLLADFAIKKINKKIGTRIQGLSLEALQVLENYNWPGNVRELENILERAVFLCQGSVIQPKDIYLPKVQTPSCKDTPELSEKEVLRDYLLTYGYSLQGKKEVAKRLNISLATLYNKLKSYGLTNFYLRNYK
jgi:PAS domain S-box-containing protein